jgi:hypothetical protein
MLDSRPRSGGTGVATPPPSTTLRSPVVSTHRERMSCFDSDQRPKGRTVRASNSCATTVVNLGGASIAAAYDPKGYEVCRRAWRGVLARWIIADCRVPS